MVAEARGAADALALRLRFSDAALHVARAPGGDGDARLVFDALETVRVEALGARSFPGIRQNLSALTDARMRTDAIGRARSAEEVPLATAVAWERSEWARLQRTRDHREALAAFFAKREPVFTGE